MRKKPSSQETTPQVSASFPWANTQSHRLLGLGGRLWKRAFPFSSLCGGGSKAGVWAYQAQEAATTEEPGSVCVCSLLWTRGQSCGVAGVGVDVPAGVKALRREHVEGQTLQLRQLLLE